MTTVCALALFKTKADVIDPGVRWVGTICVDVAAYMTNEYSCEQKHKNSESQTYSIPIHLKLAFGNDSGVLEFTAFVDEKEAGKKWIDFD
jgi:hypothetical protein